MTDQDSEAQYKQRFIERVREARRSTGLSQQKIAGAMGFPQDHYKWWEQRGEKGRLMPHHLIDRFCIICRVDPTWLVTGHGKMAAKPPLAEVPKPEPITKPRRSKLVA